MDKFWIIKNQTGISADLQLYGPISNESWWGDEVTPQNFANDLKNLGPIQELNVHINSGGGDVFAGVAIYNMLKAHPATVNVYVDGLAASIASVIAMAGDTITMQNGSMMMIHNPASGLFGYYEAGDMRKIADTLDSIKDSIMGIYATKCGKTKDEIATIMDDETWFTAQNAVNSGFATCTDTSISCVASLDKSTIIINGISCDTSRFKHVPQIANAVNTLYAGDKTSKENEEDSLMTIDELKNKYPDVYKAAHNEGVQTERTRMKAIDELSMPGHDDLINKARYETGSSAEQVAMQIIKAEKGARDKVLTDTAKDVIDSHVNNVPNDTPPNNDENEQIQAAANLIAQAANQGRIK